MPIRRELRQFYGKQWQEETRPAILERAGDRCEQCKVPDRMTVVRFDRPEYAGWWFTQEGDGFNNSGEAQGSARGPGPKMPEDYHLVNIMIGVAHLNHQAGDDRPENLKGLCQWCHLQHDREHHKAASKETRLDRKDAARPLLKGLA